MNRSVTMLNTESELLASLHDAMESEYEQVLADMAATSDIHESYRLLGVGQGLLAAQRILTTRMKAILDELRAE